jgi:hypothetical protein
MHASVNYDNIYPQKELAMVIDTFDHGYDQSYLSKFRLIQIFFNDENQFLCSWKYFAINNIVKQWTIEHENPNKQITKNTTFLRMKSAHFYALQILTFFASKVDLLTINAF